MDHPVSTEGVFGDVTTLLQETTITPLTILTSTFTPNTTKFNLKKELDQLVNVSIHETCIYMVGIY